MNEKFQKLGFYPADILLPKDADMTKWAVVACDQFTSQPEYWQRAEARAELTPPFEGYDSAQFEAGDHLIGWQNDRHAYRYCHHFDDQQITDLVRGVRTFYKSGEVPVRELERFHADGRSGKLNRYVILKRL